MVMVYIDSCELRLVLRGNESIRECTDGSNVHHDALGLLSGHMRDDSLDEPKGRHDVRLEGVVDRLQWEIEDGA
jgi:hypothetical protein